MTTTGTASPTDPDTASPTDSDTASPTDFDTASGSDSESGPGLPCKDWRYGKYRKYGYGSRYSDEE